MPDEIRVGARIRIPGHSRIGTLIAIEEQEPGYPVLAVVSFSDGNVTRCALVDVRPVRGYLGSK